MGDFEAAVRDAQAGVREWLHTSADARARTFATALADARLR